ncbi:phosphotransferase [Taibaiella koreensis]|uniref:phosphotransferase n=1 Tax=Taibaiella koreensis TaxID=1268548 RepID=UPI000E5A0E67|nr:phosphotransferase [Taibaiella koreensis]
MTAANDNLPAGLRACLRDALGLNAAQAIVPDCGLSAALRFSVQMEDGSKVFVKAATDDSTEQWLRREHLVLSATIKPCMPAVIAWIDRRGKRPVLLSEDLSHAYWPASHQGVTWCEGDIPLLLSAVEALSSLDTMPGLPPLENRNRSLWTWIKAHPKALLALGLCSPEWLNHSLNTLTEAKQQADVTGDRLVHGDLRSDNICILDGQVKFVDWSHAACGAVGYDLALLLPTLRLEGGPDPYQLLPHGGSFAATACAGHIYRLAADRAMPGWLRNVFLKLIAIELSWAAAGLGLAPPDGRSWLEI